MLVILFTAIIKTQNENCTQSIFRVVIQFRETQKFNLLSNFQFFPIYFLCVKKCWTTEEIKMEKKKGKKRNLINSKRFIESTGWLHPIYVSFPRFFPISILFYCLVCENSEFPIFSTIW